MVSDGDAAENGAVGINDYMVLQNRVTGNTLDGMSVIIHGETFSTQRDALIQLHMVTDNAGGSYHYACSVVDGEMMTYRGTWMDVNTRLAMCHFCDDSWNQRHPQTQQLMGNTIIRDGFDDRIARDNFPIALCRWVAQAPADGQSWLVPVRRLSVGVHPVL